jgi:hypothetical protein
VTTPETVAAAIVALAGMGLTAIARGWLVVSLSVRVVPLTKRTPAGTPAIQPAPVEELAVHREAAA